MSQAESLHLKPVSSSSADTESFKLFNWRNDQRIYKWCRQFERLSWDSHEKWLEWQAKDPNTKMYGLWTDHDLIGVCGLTSIDWINRRAEFSLYIGPEYQGKGYGSKALMTLCDHGFKILNLNCIWGEAFDGNPAIEMFLSVGFKEEGRRRQFYYREGKYIDAILFSLLRSEYDSGSVKCNDVGSESVFSDSALADHCGYQSASSRFENVADVLTPENCHKACSVW